LCLARLNSFSSGGKRGWFLFPLFLSLFLVGCVASTADVENLDSRLTVVENRLATVNERLNSLENRLTLLEKRVDKGEDTLRTRMADVDASIQELRGEIRYLRDGVERSDKAISDLGGHIAQLDERISALEKGVKVIENKEKRKPLDPVKFYNSALKLYRSGQYLDAMDAFNRFIKKFPRHKLAGNAQYWIGECLLAMGKKKEAILAFDKVVKKYPGSPKLPSALLKEGLVFLSMGDRTVARILLKRVVDEYPDTDQARIAAKKLRSLGTSGKVKKTKGKK